MEREVILRKLQDLETKGARHGFLVYGESAGGAEKLALEICRWLEKEKLLPFRGSVEHFSIVMPYFTDEDGARHFLGFLKECVSIARDCYEEFCGIILVECAAEWTKYGPNEAMRPVMDYFRTLSEVRYIIVLPAVSDRTKVEALLPAFSLAGLWVVAEAEELDENRLRSAILWVAKKQGYAVTEEVLEALRERLDGLSHVDVERLAEEWILQLSLNRHMREDSSRLVTTEDLACLAGIYFERKALGFGFTQNR